ncbi:hypothetical protein HII12_000587 [Brettanomyces bruxellensis]|uniref:BPL/LPL catalytic domain-containing protein n=1 Tax=Dekkera bruxellensis TaxID=5007 RepID=A0A8H6BQ31_DEKBR|nr:hypothetical protein HII12_000587 [Brettanomyces bruxellensis]
MLVKLFERFSCKFYSSRIARNTENTICGTFKVKNSTSSSFGTFAQQKNLRMNVLVYSGQGTTDDSVKHCVETMRLLLSPYYSVSKASADTIIKQPWQGKTTMLVIPGGADLPVCRAFNGRTNEKISQFVNRGGRFIGFCAGGYYGSKRCEFETGTDMEVSGPRELGFFPGICRGCAFRGFRYGSEAGARAAKLEVNRASLPDCQYSTAYSYYNGGGMFVDAPNYPNVEILARYSDQPDVPDGPGGANAAVVYCKVGNGAAMLSGVHPEFTPELLARSAEAPGFGKVVDVLKGHNEERMDFLRACLKKMGLHVNESTSVGRPHLTPLFLTSVNKTDTQQVIGRLERELPHGIDNISNGGSDKFRFHWSLSELGDKLPEEGYEDPETAIKEVYACVDRLPTREETPNFDIGAFLCELPRAYSNLSTVGAVGKTFMYGEVVTSTSALMDSNIHLMGVLPDGFTVYGSIQVCGKGRSGNFWVNPIGMMAVSIFNRMSLEQAQRTPIVFIQYLCSMALIEAIWHYGDGYSEIPVRIKWPNDVYIMLPKFVERGEHYKSQKLGTVTSDGEIEATYTKVGEIMVNVNVINREYCFVVGSGLDVSNAAPTVSINSVIEAMNRYWGQTGQDKHLAPLKIETLLARYLASFNSMLNIFKAEGFRPFLDTYYSMWLHTNQTVRLTSEGDARARIIGITSDWGMLLVQKTDSQGRATGENYELQPDGNSFDMFRGLISKRK